MGSICFVFWFSIQELTFFVAKLKNIKKHMGQLYRACVDKEIISWSGSKLVPCAGVDQDKISWGRSKIVPCACVDHEIISCCGGNGVHCARVDHEIISCLSPIPEATWSLQLFSFSWGSWTVRTMQDSKTIIFIFITILKTDLPFWEKPFSEITV